MGSAVLLWQNSSGDDVVAEGAEVSSVEAAVRAYKVNCRRSACVSELVVEAVVIPHFNCWIECCNEEFWSFGCADDVTSGWYSVQRLVFVVL